MAIEHKIDFVALISVHMANSNGDPLDGNRPRTNYDGYGEISDVCIKRKIRNRMQDMGQAIFVQSSDRSDDGFSSLSERASAAMGKEKNRELYTQKACEKWLDVRSFGQVFAFKSNEKKKSTRENGQSHTDEEKEQGVSVGVRGPVSIHQAVSVSPIDVISMQITKSVNGEPDEKRSSDTMGTKHMVRFGLYVLKGSVNAQLAEKTGFSAGDAQILKECLRTLFRNDASSARPEGSMEVSRLYWFEHGCKDGQYSSAKVHRSIHIEPKNKAAAPASFEDYDVTVEELPGLKPEVIEGE